MSDAPIEHRADQAGPAWKPVLAALGNEAARTVFARAALGQLDPRAREALGAREQKAVTTWRGLGVLVEDPDGSLSVDGAVLRAALTVPGEGQGKARTGVGRFLDGPRITTMPAAVAERLELLRWVRDHTLEAGEVLTEAELNQRLRVFHRDAAMLRRYLVDASLLERTVSGTQYAIPAG